jgi:hypothetical protein
VKNNYAHVAICILNYCAWPMPYHFRRLHKLATWQRSDFISLNIKYLCLCVWFCTLFIVAMFFKRGTSLFSLLFLVSVILQRVLVSSSPNAYGFILFSLSVLVHSYQVHLSHTISSWVIYSLRHVVFFRYEHWCFHCAWEEKIF